MTSADAYVIDHWERQTDAEMAAQIGCRIGAVEKIRERLRLLRDNNNRAAMASIPDKPAWWPRSSVPSECAIRKAVAESDRRHGLALLAERRG